MYDIKISLYESEFTSSTDSLTTDDTMSCYYQAGANPTEQELQDIKNKLDDGSGEIAFDDFCKVMTGLQKELDEEALYRETFRTFHKDSDGCIPSQEIKFVFEHLGVRSS